MNSVRPHPCSICQQLTHAKGMCEACRQRRKASGYGEAWLRSQRVIDIHKAYYTQRWKLLRTKILARDKYLCVQCLKKGIYTPATEVDHIQATALGGSMFNEKNLQSLCHRCHLHKTSQERNKGKGV
ncbi:MAG: HNH endonuclease signature motif containing protein [Succinatimonas sp.]|nr:HNH endonuclease signature motif containing protein [Succinatimonas sp.]